jgi:hypothetical protein
VTAAGALTAMRVGVPPASREPVTGRAGVVAAFTPPTRAGDTGAEGGASLGAGGLAAAGSGPAGVTGRRSPS